MKIGIGTVQFGLPYGISNSSGQTSLEEVGRILELARRAGIRVLDTAPAYGESERVLGECLRGRHGQGSWRLVTKGPAAAVKEVTSDCIASYRKTIENSLALLSPQPVDTFLLHRCEHLLVPGGELLAKELLHWKETGLVKRLGVSVYQEAEVEGAQHLLPLDVVQVPFSLLDQRLLSSGALARWKARGTEVHARSVFLQGLLLMQIGQIPATLSGVRPALERLEKVCQERGWSRLEAALAFAQSVPEIDCLILGINTEAQLTEILAASQKKWVGESQNFALQDEQILNPALWKA